MGCICPVIRANSNTGSKFCEKPTKSSNGMLVRAGTDLLSFIAHLSRATIFSHREKEKEEDNSVTDPVTAVYNREEELQDDQINRHKGFEIVDENKFEIDCQNNFKIGKNYAKIRQEI